jgi:hypothetical protein
LNHRGTEAAEINEEERKDQLDLRTSPKFKLSFSASSGEEGKDVSNSELKNS